MSDTDAHDDEHGPIAAGPAMIALMSARNTEAALRWRGVHLVALFNVPAVVAAGYQSLESPPLAELAVLTALSTVGVALNFLWYHVLVRDGNLLDFWNESLLSLEQTNGIEGNIKVFTSRRYRRLAASRGRLQHRLETLAICLIILWSTFTVLQIVRMVS